MIALADDAIDPAGLLAAFTAATPGAGAIVSFSGVVRPRDGAAAISGLWLDHHERLTPAALAGLHGDACARFALIDLAIVHRIGAVAAGAPIVFVAAAAAHRRAAFDAVDFAMDWLKSAVPLWKREDRDDGARWVEPHGDDHAAAARWTTNDG